MKDALNALFTQHLLAASEVQRALGITDLRYRQLLQVGRLKPVDPTWPQPRFLAKEVAERALRLRMQDEGHSLPSGNSLDHALAYAVHQLAIVPLWGNNGDSCNCADDACWSAFGNHINIDLAPHGVDDATCDQQTIFDWFVRYPKTRFGIALALNNLVVVRVDEPPPWTDFPLPLQRQWEYMEVFRSTAAVEEAGDPFYLFSLRGQEVQAGPISSQVAIVTDFAQVDDYMVGRSGFVLLHEWPLPMECIAELFTDVNPGASGNE